jgi:hypothetical protein
MQLLIMEFLQPPVTSSLLGPNILLSTLLYTLILCFVIAHLPWTRTRYGHKDLKTNS